jgi:hypothetical protein
VNGEQVLTDVLLPDTQSHLSSHAKTLLLGINVGINFTQVWQTSFLTKKFSYGFRAKWKSKDVWQWAGLISSICNLRDWNLLTNQFIFQNNFWFVGFHSKRPYATRNFLSPHFTSTHSHWLESKSKSLLQKKLFDIKRSEPTEDAFHHTNTNISINCVLYILWPRLW